MSSSLDRRLRRLETVTQIKLPWGRPPREWTDEQLMAVIGEPGPLSDERLAELIGSRVIIAGNTDAIILGVPEAESTEAWVRRHAASPVAAVDHTDRLPPKELDS